MELMVEVEVVLSSKVGGESLDMMESFRLDPEIYEWAIMDSPTCTGCA